MSDRLPPLTALRAFEAAARHMSFARAAAELNVTPAALSFQIKSLEERLGRPVFRRLNRAVELTPAGRALAPGASEGFSALSSAWRAARRQGDGRTLTVTAGPAFTAKWLAPRLFAFAQAHPEIELRFSASLRIMDFDRDEVDVAIRFGHPNRDPGLHAETVIEEWVTPMMVPELARRVRAPADLLDLPLLHQDDTAVQRWAMDWSAWFEAAGLPVPEETGTRFSQADHAIDAAVGGAGAILGRISLCEGHVRDGSLAMPLPLSLRPGTQFSVVCPKGSETRPQVARFVEWVRAETGGIAAMAEGRVFP